MKSSSKGTVKISCALTLDYHSRRLFLLPLIAELFFIELTPSELDFELLSQQSSSWERNKSSIILQNNL